MAGMAGEAEFAAWVKEKGGDKQFLSVLASFGFTSKLSLGAYRWLLAYILSMPIVKPGAPASREANHRYSGWRVEYL